jgi:hypothetical protein
LKIDEQKNAPELPIGRFLKSESLGGNRVIFAVLAIKPNRELPRAQLSAAVLVLEWTVTCKPNVEHGKMVGYGGY